MRDEGEWKERGGPIGEGAAGGGGYGGCPRGLRRGFGWGALARVA
ncbi:MAG: hypothetical protein RLZZ142_446, partial [Verrucomicrobiota bacterium]